MVRLWQGQRSAPEELVPVSPLRAPGRDLANCFGPSRWFAGPIRPGQRMTPKWIMPHVCDAGGITRDEVGAIRIGRDEFFVEISEGAVEGFLDALGPLMEIDRGVALAMVDGPPADLRSVKDGVHPARAHRKGPRPPRGDDFAGDRPARSAPHAAKPGKKSWPKPGAAKDGGPTGKPGGKPWSSEGGPSKGPHKGPGKGKVKGAPKGAPRGKVRSAKPPRRGD
jgi:ATP-dependent RNA helicase DeaD